MLMNTTFLGDSFSIKWQSRAAFFENGMFELIPGNIQARAIVWFVLGFVLLRKTKLGPVPVMLLCGVLETVASAVLGEM